MFKKSLNNNNSNNNNVEFKAIARIAKGQGIKNNLLVVRHKEETDTAEMY